MSWMDVSDGERGSAMNPRRAYRVVAATNYGEQVSNQIKTNQDYKTGGLQVGPVDEI